jgi:hypothetical protein
MSLSGVMVPVLFLLLFAGVFGHTLRAGLGAAVPPGGARFKPLIASACRAGLRAEPGQRLTGM